jgi:addiction module HigA family antidote
MSNPLAHFEPDWFVPPGATIADLLEELNWTQAELAFRMGVSRKHVNLLIKGNAPIDDDTALKLERALGSTMEFWLIREAHYREALARKHEKDILKKDLNWLKEIPISEMIKLDWVKDCKNKIAQITECLQFFGVSSVEIWRSKWTIDLAAYRAKKLQDNSKGTIAAWIRQCERKATKLNTPPYNKEKFKEILQEARKLTQSETCSIFIPKLIKLCAEAGVTVITLSTIKNCPISGATRWLGPNKPLLMLSDKYKSLDQFWFTFFHEAGHVLFHAKKILHIDTDGQLTSQEELEANKFSSESLIPKEYTNELLTLPTDENSIKNFAKKIGSSPGIIVGRLQREGLLRWATNLNRLKGTIQFANDL